MCATNIGAAKELVKKYRSITLEDLKKEDRFSSDLKSMTLFSITGFGSSRCPICNAVNECCLNCILYHNGQECYHQDTYQAIRSSKTLEELLTAIRNRADYIEYLIKEQNGN